MYNINYTYELHRTDQATAKNVTIPCSIIFSNRRTVAIQINEQGDVTVRASYYASNRDIERFLKDKVDWIYQKREEALLRNASSLATPLSIVQQKQLAMMERKLKAAAKIRFRDRVECYHPLTGGSYTNITIRDQKSRWGSCSSSGTLSFNYRLMLAPPIILDYVVVHELCHFTHMNHSKEFWSMVGSILPDYREYRRWLKVHGHELSLEAQLPK